MSEISSEYIEKGLNPDTSYTKRLSGLDKCQRSAEGKVQIIQNTDDYDPSTKFEIDWNEIEEKGRNVKAQSKSKKDLAEQDKIIDDFTNKLQDVTEAKKPTIIERAKEIINNTLYHTTGKMLRHFLGWRENEPLMFHKMYHGEQVKERKEEVDSLATPQVKERLYVALADGDGPMIEACVDRLIDNEDDGIEGWAALMYGVYSGKCDGLKIEDCINLGDPKGKGFHVIFYNFRQFDEHIKKGLIDKKYLKEQCSTVESGMDFFIQWSKGYIAMETTQKKAYTDENGKTVEIPGTLHIKDMDEMYVHFTKQVPNIDPENVQDLGWLLDSTLLENYVGRNTDGQLRISHLNKVFRSLLGSQNYLSFLDLKAYNVRENLKEKFKKDGIKIDKKKLDEAVNIRMSIDMGGKRNFYRERAELEDRIRGWLKAVKPSEYQNLLMLADELLGTEDLRDNLDEKVSQLEPPAQFYIQELYELKGMPGYAVTIANAFRLRISKYGLETDVSNILHPASKAEGERESAIILADPENKSFHRNKYKKTDTRSVIDSEEEQEAIRKVSQTDKPKEILNLLDEKIQTNDNFVYALENIYLKNKDKYSDTEQQDIKELETRILKRIEPMTEIAPEGTKGKYVTKIDAIKAILNNKNLSHIFEATQINRWLEKLTQIAPDSAKRIKDIRTLNVRLKENIGHNRLTEEEFTKYENLKLITDPKAIENLVKYYSTYCIANPSLLNKETLENFRREYKSTTKEYVEFINKALTAVGKEEKGKIIDLYNFLGNIDKDGIIILDETIKGFKALKPETFVDIINTNYKDLKKNEYESIESLNIPKEEYFHNISEKTCQKIIELDKDVKDINNKLFPKYIPYIKTSTIEALKSNASTQAATIEALEKSSESPLAQVNYIKQGIVKFDELDSKKQESLAINLCIEIGEGGKYKIYEFLEKNYIKKSDLSAKILDAIIKVINKKQTSLLFESGFFDDEIDNLEEISTLFNTYNDAEKIAQYILSKKKFNLIKNIQQKSIFKRLIGKGFLTKVSLKDIANSFHLFDSKDLKNLLEQRSENKSSILDELAKENKEKFSDIFMKILGELNEDEFNQIKKIIKDCDMNISLGKEYTDPENPEKKKVDNFQNLIEKAEKIRIPADLTEFVKLPEIKALIEKPKGTSNDEDLRIIKKLIADSNGALLNHLDIKTFSMDEIDQLLIYIKDYQIQSFVKNLDFSSPEQIKEFLNTTRINEQRINTVGYNARIHIYRNLPTEAKEKIKLYVKNLNNVDKERYFGPSASQGMQKYMINLFINIYEEIDQKEAEKIIIEHKLNPIMSDFLTKHSDGTLSNSLINGLKTILKDTDIKNIQSTDQITLCERIWHNINTRGAFPENILEMYRNSKNYYEVIRTIISDYAADLLKPFLGEKQNESETEKKERERVKEEKREAIAEIFKNNQ